VPSRGPRDRPPEEIQALDERLIRRFAGGLVIDIGAPDYETRIAILRARCDERGVRFQAGVLEELSTLEFRNIRELQGALNRLIAAQTLGGEQVRAEQVRGMFATDAAAARGATPARAPRTSGRMDFQNFVRDIASAVERQIDPWKIKVAEAVAYWSGEGYRTSTLERLLQESRPESDYEGALRDFFAAIERLRVLEGEATAIDPALGANEVFRDPQRLA